MSIHLVTGVWDGNTLEVTPEWEFEGKKGNMIQTKGYTAPKSGKAAMNIEQRLSALLLNKNVELHSPEDVQRNRLVCEVYLNNINLADYFTEYKDRASAEPEIEQEFQQDIDVEEKADSEYKETEDR